MAISKKSGTLFGTPPLTPLMAQYAQVKAKYPDAVLLFRVGDFYETFGEDAVRTSRALGITLTSRNNGGADVELAGFPYHALDLYLPRLVRAGYRVAICEQMEKPVPGKVVKRSVTAMVTPGVTTEDSLLQFNRNNYLATLSYGKQDQYGIAFLDISTGEFLVSEGDAAAIDKLLQSFSPAEIVLPKSRLREFHSQFGDKNYTFCLEDWIFTHDFGREKLLQHFQTSSLKGFGIEDQELAQAAAGAVLQYLNTTENNRLAHILSISRIQPEQFVWLDRFTIRNLELVNSSQEQGVSLLQVIDRSISPMGGRLLRKWLLLPLTSRQEIEERQDAVDYFLQQEETAAHLESSIRQIGDLERLIAKTAIGKISPREMLQLQRALTAIDNLKKHLDSAQNRTLRLLGETLHLCPSLRKRIEEHIAPDAPNDARKGNFIAQGAHPEIDELRQLARNAKDIILEIQQREIESTGIPSLKIGFNSVFGYYIEVTAKWKEQVPPTWIRKQTIANGERFITEELKLLESKILGAEERILTLEQEVFQELVKTAAAFTQPILHNASLVAQLDCLLSFAQSARKGQFTRPTVDDSLVIDIKSGRHPVIETQLPVGEPFVPNDIYLDRDDCQIALITGPNMAGKSALLRQTALITLLAQIGSFVPAASARIGLVDKIFTRVGASDNISGGESTFMVEMNETALIMNNISDRSLILLDEIGRGTSTYDGISIAWSIAEFLHENSKANPKTLFATHYHELNELANRFPRIKNFHVRTREVGQKVVFLRKLAPGGTNHSFGIHVAKMAGMPQSLVDRAYQILADLEAKHIGNPSDTAANALAIAPPVQLKIVDADSLPQQLKTEIIQLDLNTMTPMDALWKLHELKKLAEK
jgi:DNA mismatch repair protein MutS